MTFQGEVPGVDEVDLGVRDRQRPNGAQYVKIWFRFVPREGWLPYDTEGLWAVEVGPDVARVSNVPFLQDGVAEGDVVRFMTDPDGIRWATGRVEASGNCTVRVLPIPSGPLGPSAQAVHDRLAPFGLGGESFSEDLPLVALNVPADADFPRIKAVLLQGEAEGWWQFEEACVTDAWETA
ncbi:DUF4265 domain-containing protein [Micromonospora purpureochromogenes]|uniref:DUF4265 domain-containing protein n=1 Tax=Micromonospora purpureochromogenes TaxID=47872 RepID=UPI0033345110